MNGSKVSCSPGIFNIDMQYIDSIVALAIIYSFLEFSVCVVKYTCISYIPSSAEKRVGKGCLPDNILGNQLPEEIQIKMQIGKFQHFISDGI